MILSRWPLALSLIASLWPLQCVNAEEPAIGTVAALQGTALMRAAGSSADVSLATGSRLSEGAAVTTGPDSRLKIALRDGSDLTLGATTTIKLDHLNVGAGGRSESVFSQVDGYLRAVIAKVSPGTRLEVRTPSMVAAVRGTEWIQNYSAGVTQIFVVKGRVRASGTGHYAANHVTLAAGEGVSFSDHARHTPVVRWKQPKIDLFTAATSLR